MQNLSISFVNAKSTVFALRDFSLSAEKGEVIGLVGESGSGKSIFGLSLLGLLPPSAKVTSTEIKLAGQNFDLRSRKDLQTLRGPTLGMIFQDPVNSLDPCYTVGDQLKEVLRRNPTVQVWHKEALELLRGVGIAEAQTRLKNYPHELSGGLCQRIQIALALAQNPKVLIADEPTTALDVTIQKQVMDLLMKKKQEYDFTLILISHDLGLISQYCDRTVVLYAGEKMEEGPAEDVLKSATHPYTQALLEALPYQVDMVRLKPIPGLVPDLRNSPKNNCVFAGRCEREAPLCTQQKPNWRHHRRQGFLCHFPLFEVEASP